MDRKKPTPMVIANWKMNTTLADAMVLGEGVRNGLEDIQGVRVVLCPPFTWLYPLKEVMRHSPVHMDLGAQDIHWEDSGAFTGEISPVMLKGMAKYVIIGHSERRFHFKETDDLINDKLKAALKNGLLPILCVGERKKMDDRSLDKTEGVVNEAVQQLTKALNGIEASEMKKVVIAYEPVWAIGTGEAATGDYAAAVTEQLRESLRFLYNDEIAEETRILYGGSVNGENVREFTDQEVIDGVLAGTASLKTREFLKICRAVGMRG